MIPDGALSSEVMAAPWAFGQPQPRLVESIHVGGVAINDASQGLRVKTWTCTTNGTDVFIADGVSAPVLLFSSTGITEVSLAFDQNMNPFVAFVDSLGARFRWFDSVAADYVITSLPAGSITPRATLDDNRGSQIASSDVILAYVRSGVLYYRQQRDRFLNEYQLKTGLFGPLRAVGMNTVLRLQFQVGSTPT